MKTNSMKRANIISSIRGVKMSSLPLEEKQNRLKSLEKELNSIPKTEKMVFILEIDGDYIGAFNSKEELDEYLEDKNQGKIKITKQKSLY